MLRPSNVRWLENAKRRPTSEIGYLYPQWDTSGLHEHDTLWTEALEPNHECLGRLLEGVRWLWERPESHIAVVAHGGVFGLMMQHWAAPDASARFRNCELRTLILTEDQERKGSFAFLNSGHPSITAPTSVGSRLGSKPQGRAPRSATSTAQNEAGAAEEGHSTSDSI